MNISLRIFKLLQVILPTVNVSRSQKNNLIGKDQHKVVVELNEWGKVTTTYSSLITKDPHHTIILGQHLKHLPNRRLVAYHSK